MKKPELPKYVFRRLQPIELSSDLCALTEQNVAMGITVVHQTANRGRQIHVTVLSYWMI